MCRILSKEGRLFYSWAPSQRAPLFKLSQLLAFTVIRCGREALGRGLVDTLLKPRSNTHTLCRCTFPRPRVVTNRELTVPWLASSLGGIHCCGRACPTSTVC